MSAPAPVAVGYVSARGQDTLDAQRDAVTEHARVEGYALAQIVTDRFDGHTISQLIDTARRHGAQAVIVPAATTLASARARLAHELEADGAVCLLIDQPATTAVDPETTTTKASARLTDAFPRHASRPTPRHAARTRA
ncbi:hypothetical protein [Myceligenerans pegani]|uniref:Resolvase/invertase-type recombinase catalytic domain-containing protein n=1 Tax=Myceligenerans pegani TaxID=2776917 RepID=A0ABR9N267_9MICO|nr:hypothetical protein [Myceligenerans sp. TRM 65318]MBE1877755.1 hypothetical protein [Myceligenerans sp. TRM 65318]MBE3020026.1 hypothetical protein [Myceligenerans sp. TRM 65318]